MSSEARRRLATVAADAGYPGALLAEIAVATLPAYTTGERLADEQLSLIADAVELLARRG